MVDKELKISSYLHMVTTFGSDDEIEQFKALLKMMRILINQTPI